jgi:hypothetical protein
MVTELVGEFSSSEYMTDAILCRFKGLSKNYLTRMVDDVHKPFVQTWESLELRFHHLHGILRQFHARLIGRRDQFYDRPLALPGHRRSKPDHGLNGPTLTVAWASIERRNTVSAVSAA